MAFDADELTDAARGHLPDAIDLRRELHAHPELGLDLPRTQEAVVERLTDLGLGEGLQRGRTSTSVTTDLVGDPTGPTLLLRADMDALPVPEDTDLDFRSQVGGTMHACGHDAHTAMLLGAAALLAARRDQLRGTVRFMFQPGEEGHHGARHMLDEGVAEGVDRAFAIHITPNLPAGWVATRGGPFMASADEFEVVIRGRGGHASTPHLANDPIPVACEVVTALATFTTRRIDAFQPGVITVSRVRAGTADNVIPETALLSGTIRAVSGHTRAAALDAVARVATGIASAHDMEAEVRIDEGYPVTVNDPERAVGVLGVAGALVGDAAVEMPTPIMGAEDFSYVLQAVPGAMAFLGACPEGADPRTVPANHSNRMLLAEDAMATGIALHAAVALDHLG